MLSWEFLGGNPILNGFKVNLYYKHLMKTVPLISGINLSNDEVNNIDVLNWLFINTHSAF